MPACALPTAEFADRLLAASEFVVPALKSGAKVSRRVLNSAMERSFEARSADGTWTQRDSFQMLEIAVLRLITSRNWPSSPTDALAALAQIEAQLPTQTVRSEEQVSLQHFSTPLVLAWSVTQLADIRADDIVLEPSAGTGILGVWARHASAMHLNEIDPVRQEILHRLFPGATVMGHA